MEVDMSFPISKTLMCGLLCIFSMLSGVWLSHSGKPFNTMIFAIHKFIAVATIIFIAVNVYNLSKAVDMQLYVELGVVAVTGLLFLALLISGALLSVNISVPAAVFKIHQVAPLLGLVAASIAIYLLASSRA
jgi:hypothetical protein